MAGVRPGSAGPTGRPASSALYVELHAHSNYSLLDGASHPEELIEQAKALGYEALALTDHDNLFGAMVFARACNEAQIRPITGVELTLAEDPEHGPRHHLTLLAASRQGYANLCRLVSLGCGLEVEDMKTRDARRREPCLPLHRLAEHCEGLVCLTGCRHGEIAAAISEGRPEAAEAALRRWLEWFGRENVFVELQDNLVHGDRPRNRALSALARRFGVPTVATGNVHYHHPDRARLQDALVAIRHRTSLEESHQVRRPNHEFFLRPPEQQLRRFAEFPEALANTRLVAERCSFVLTGDLGYELPSPPVPEGYDPDSWLGELCRTALAARYSEDDLEEASDRLEKELGLIRQHGLSGFFLVYHEVLQLAKDVAKEVRGESGRSRANLPPGRGRGSSVGSIVCYLIGLSHIDPVQKKLFLGRFLNEEMQSLPDIDLDFPRDIRARLFERVYERWGADHAGIVATFPRYRVRSAIRDLGKALGLPLRELDRLAKFAEGYGNAGSIEHEMSREPQFRALVDAPGWRELIDLARQLADFPRHLSQHVGGMVISSQPLIECVPVQPSAWAGRYLCQWDKDSVDDARMVKIDFLALGMLSLVEECLDLIADQRGQVIDLSRIDFGDDRVYDRIKEGDTVGVFQIESRAQAQMLPRTQPRSLDDLTVQVAIVRPGPIVGGAVNPYVRQREAMRRNQAFKPDVPACLEEVLEETYGVVLFQEQVVLVAMEMGNMSPGQAESFRRLLSRRDAGQSISHYEEIFMKGAEEHQVTPETARKVWDGLCGFASFGFPKSHAAAFALLAYQSAYLKEYFGPEFYCALYNNWPMGFYPPHVFTNDAHRHGVEVLRPDVNVSREKSSVEKGAVRLGLEQVQGVGGAGATAIVSERDRAGLYRSLFELSHGTGIGREALENLIQAGALDGFGLNRRELLWQLGLFTDGLERARLTAPPQLRQLHLAIPTEQDELTLPDFEGFEKMAADYRVLHLSPDSHPMSFLRSALREGVASSRELQEMRAPRMVETAGLVVCRQRPGTARGIVFLLLEDEHGLSNVMIPPDLYEERRSLVRMRPFLQVRARLEGHAGKVPMLQALEIEAVGAFASLQTPEGKSWG
jgi:error-prone DNA polymerase